MAFSLNGFYRAQGTRFRLFAQSPVLEGFARPETVWVSSPAGSLGPGPSDARIYVVEPLEKKPYADSDLPPFRGRVAPPVDPCAGGHFDHLAPGDPGFECAHMFGAVRRVLDVWETYLGGPLHWHFAGTHSRLEMIPHVPWNNAHFGWGFMECGEGADDQGAMRPFALNFDVLAHETGHGILFALGGMPTPEGMTAAWRGFHESASDCVAMISALHFESFVDHVLSATSGDLYVENEMNRIGELSPTRQIRNASNALKLSDVEGLDRPATELTGGQVHALGQPLTGAVFDIGVEFFMDGLVDAGLVTRAYASDVRAAARDDRVEQLDRAPCVEAFHDDPAGFRGALGDARDLIGLRLAETWRRIEPDYFSYQILARTFLRVDREMTGDANRRAIRECFEWREIDPG